MARNDKDSLLLKIIKLTEKEDLTDLIYRLRAQCHLASDDTLWTESHEASFGDFLQNSERKLVVLCRVENGLRSAESVAELLSDNRGESIIQDEICTFIKSAPVTSDNFGEVLCHRSLNLADVGKETEKLLCSERLRILSDEVLTSYIKHNLLIALDRLRYKILSADGDFVLKWPFGDLEPENQPSEYELLRLESAATECFAVVLDAFAACSSNVPEKLFGLEEECRLLQLEASILSNLSSQLQSPEACLLSKRLAAGKSVYFRHFADYQNLVKMNLEMVEDSLSAIKKCCPPLFDYDNIDICILPTLCQEQFRQIIATCQNIKRLGDRLVLTRIIQQASYDILRKLGEDIDLAMVFGGYIESFILVIKQQEENVEAFKVAVESVLPEELDSALCTAYFVDYKIRLSHLTEIADCQQQFGRMSHGTRYVQEEVDIEIGEELLLVERKYEKVIEDLKENRDRALDINDEEWYAVYEKFTEDILELEVLVTNVLERTLDKPLKLQELSSALSFFRRFSSRHSVKVAMLKCVGKLYEIAEFETMEILKTAEDAEFYNYDEDLGDFVSEETRHAVIIKRAIKSTEDILQVVEGLVWIPCGNRNTVVQRCCQSSLERMRMLIEQLFSDWLTRLRKTLTEGVVGKSLAMGRKKPPSDLMTKGLLLLLNSPVMCRFVGNPLLLKATLDRLVLEALYSCDWWEHLDVQMPSELRKFWERKEIVTSRWEQVKTLVSAYNSVVKEMGSEERQLFRMELKQVDLLVDLGLTTIVWNQPQAIIALYKKLLDMTNVLGERVRVYKSLNRTVEDCCKRLEGINLFVLKGEPLKYEELMRQFENQPRAQSDVFVLPVLNSALENLRAFQLTVDMTSSQAIQQWHETARNFERKLASALLSVAKNTFTKVDQFVKLSTCPVLRVTLEFKEGKIMPSPEPTAAEDLFSTLKVSLEAAIKPGLEVVASLRTTTGNDPEMWLAELSQDKEVNETQRSLRVAMRDSFSKSKIYIDRWKVWRQFVEPDPDVFSRIYLQQQPPEDAFVADIKEFSSSRKAAMEHEELLSISAIQLDFKKVREYAVSLADKWMPVFREVVAAMAGLEEQEELIALLT